ncbi:MAG: aminopeptidase P family protein [Lachnospiraceae bacterium]|nr:aminopeptidase P family protein [Lachnospiraceae bacterium]
MENTVIRERFKKLRQAMKDNGVNATLFPTADYHDSEYVADYFKVRAYFSNFTGSNGTLFVTENESALWTDGRYFLQAESELAGTEIKLMRMGERDVPKLEEYLKGCLKEGDTLGFDGRCVTASYGETLEEAVNACKAKLRYDIDFASMVFENRPELPVHDLYLVEEAYSGASFEEKLSVLRKELDEKDADAFVLSKLDDIMWLTNLRGSDIACNPVALSYLFITPERTLFFVQEEEVTDAVRAYAKEHEIFLVDYESFFEFLLESADTQEIKNEIKKGLFFDKASVSYTLYQMLKRFEEHAGIPVINGKNPTTFLKAVKNETELRHTRETYLKDSAVLTEFLYYVKTNAGKEEMSEISLAKKLDSMRAAQEGFIELSFPTISGFGANGAIVHYEPTEKTNAKVEGTGFYLVDSGATYKGGTTDVTRTLAIGEVTQEMKEHFTKTLVGMLRLADAKFLEGCTGRNLDILARSALWQSGIDYKHGTGHGVGYMLNVHEGPQNIRYQSAAHDPFEAEFKAGMLVSDEPGVYITGSHGVRIENILEVVADEKNAYGQFLRFKHLTYVPIDLDAVDTQYMEEKDIQLLNAYHQKVYELIAPRIQDEAVKEWLKKATENVK